MTKSEELLEEWLETWFMLGLKNNNIRMAYDPPFTRQSFSAVDAPEVLLAYFRGEWNTGRAFTHQNLCFIQQGLDGADEWWTLKEDAPFESISWRLILGRDGEPAALRLLQALVTASKEDCINLRYDPRHNLP